MPLYFRILSGMHTDEKKVRYATGDVVESERNLAEVFVNKFEQLTEDEAVRFRKKKKSKKKELPVSVEPEAEEAEETPTAPEVVESADSNFGVDVSDKFGANDGGLRVFRNQDGFTVVDSDEPNKALNETPLKSVTQTKKFVERNAKV